MPDAWHSNGKHKLGWVGKNPKIRTATHAALALVCKLELGKFRCVAHTSRHWCLPLVVAFASRPLGVVLAISGGSSSGLGDLPRDAAVGAKDGQRAVCGAAVALLAL